MIIKTIRLHDVEEIIVFMDKPGLIQVQTPWGYVKLDDH